ncbi:MAG: DUF2723 domain-containing protein [Anaerolineae bacterium]
MRLLRQAWKSLGDLLLAAGGSHAFGAACCFLLSLILYFQTLAPSVATLFDDSLEFPLVAQRLAIAHPTGYPLYTLLGKLFVLGPWYNVAWAVNFLSAVAGALAVALVYLVARRLTRRRWPALVGALALAVSPVFWSQSIIAEVYTLNAAFVAGLLWLALRWAREPLLPVKPFSLLLAEPQRPRPLFLPREGLWLRLPPTVRRVAHRANMLYRRFYPPVLPRRRLRLHPMAYLLAALLGLSQAHHRTALLLVPALLVLAFLVERRVFSRAALLGPEHPDQPRWRQILGRPVLLLAACSLLPLSLYLYLALRAHVGSLDGAYADLGFWRWVTASGYGAFLSDNPLARDLDAAFYGELFWQQFGPVGLALALVGLVGLVAKREQRFHPHPRSLSLKGEGNSSPLPLGGEGWGEGGMCRFRVRALTLTGLAFLTYAAFALVYRVPDVEVFFIPAFLIVAVWIAAGLDHALDLLRIRGQSLAGRRLLAVSAVLMAAASIAQPLLLAARNYPDLDLSRRWIVHDYGRYLLDQELPYDNSTVIGLGGEMTLIEYFQAASNLRADVETVRADDEAARRSAVDAALAEGRAVFLTRPLPGLTRDYSLDAVTGLINVGGHLETLIRVSDLGDESPTIPRSTDLEPAPGLELLGYGLREHHGHWLGWARLRLWWRAPQGLAAPPKISARLVDAGGHTVAATDAEPVSGAYPTPAWRPGEVVADAYEIPLPAGLPPGDYRPLVIVYDPDTTAELGRAELEPVYLAGSPVRPPQRALEASVARTVYARFGDVELLGFTPPDPEVAYRPGDTLPLTLLWQAQGQPGGDLQVTFWLEDVEEYPLGGEPVGGRFPVGRWTDTLKGTGGQIVRQWPALQVPGDAPAGAYRLKMRVTRGGRPVAWGRWWIPLGSDLDLGLVQIGR